ncbi:MAG: hypothetical protein COT74_14035 [Bdellovibrionales bacterium CG10_big_fil_rev_8_21_14_0_10_45_34]|nr:MAG: hypothetical protein COT74_14035 [Bdellovibrionales bacterium CG10_big_fil_rev_8_21_14_0_10_45_34]
MAKGRSTIQGIYPMWRAGKKFDSLRVAIRPPNGAQVQISSKVQPTLKQINEYLRAHKLKKAAANQDNHFQALKHRLYEELKDKYALPKYKIQEKLDLKSKEFNFEDNLDEFVAFKSTHSIPFAYKGWMKRFWMPFFLGNGCNHPKDFKNFKAKARTHVMMAKTLSGKKYSHNTYSSITTPFNEYMRFLLDSGYIGQDDFYTLDIKMTLEQKKQARRRGEDVTGVRTKETYTEDELNDIKDAIDKAYKDNLEMKKKAYAIFFGVCTGLRRGNLLGLNAECLHPDDDVPNFDLKDNIVSGWSRGEKGALVFEDATKTTSGERIQLPMVQPSPKILVDVARFLKKNIAPKDRLLDCHPDTVMKWWRQIAKDCDFKFLHPHAWKHSYATIGALHLHDWYLGNPYFLQKCCLHSSFRTTEKYINQVSNQFLKAFAKK